MRQVVRYPRHDPPASLEALVVDVTGDAARAAEIEISTVHARTGRAVRALEALAAEVMGDDAAELLRLARVIGSETQGLVEALGLARRIAARHRAWLCVDALGALWARVA